MRGGLVCVDINEVNMTGAFLQYRYNCTMYHSWGEYEVCVSHRTPSEFCKLSGSMSLSSSNNDEGKMPKAIRTP